MKGVNILSVIVVCFVIFVSGCVSQTSKQVYENTDLSLKLEYPDGWEYSESGDSSFFRVHFSSLDEDNRNIVFSVSIMDLNVHTSVPKEFDAFVVNMENNIYVINNYDLEMIENGETTVDGFRAHKFDYNITEHETTSRHIDTVAVNGDTGYIFTAVIKEEYYSDYEKEIDDFVNSIEILED
jgi:hypothetical protein